MHSRDGLIELFHDGVLVATHARRHPPEKEPAVLRRRGPRPRPPTRSTSVTRKVDGTGAVSFAGASYRAATPIAAARSRCPSLATACRSASKANSSAPTRSATTGPRNTVPSPTPAEDQEDQCRLEPSPHCRQGGGATPSHGYRSSTSHTPSADSQPDSHGFARRHSGWRVRAKHARPVFGPCRQRCVSGRDAASPFRHVCRASARASAIALHCH